MKIAVQLNCVGELVVGAGEERIMAYVQSVAHSIYGKAVVKYRMGRNIIMVFSSNVVPCPRGEVLKRNVGRFPLFDPIVEDAPDIQCVDSLPTEVVNPAAQDLLAFKFNGLRSIFGAGGNIKIKLIHQVADLVTNGRLLLIPESVGIRNAGSDGKLCGPAIFAG